MPEHSELKIKLYNHCVQFVEERIRRIQEEIKSQQAAANEETKSSAGDKYETGRAMAQLEIERNNVQLAEAEKLMAVLNTISPGASMEVAGLGALIETTLGSFYLAISIGSIKVNGADYFVISSESPIGKLLLGKRTGDEFEWRMKQHTISTIL